VLKLRAERRGNVCVLVALLLPLLIGIAAIAIDGGVLMDDRQRAQSAADAAALAAAGQLFLNWQSSQGLDPKGKAVAAAQALATQNGFPTVAVNICPATYASGPNQGKSIPPGYAEAIITYSQKRYFSAIYGSTQITVRARAVARGQWKASNNGILVLNPTASGALTDVGNGTLKVVGASLIVDSSASDGGTATGGGTVSAPEIDFSGSPGYSGSGTWQGTLKSSQPPTPDPLAYLPEPDPSTMTSYNKVTLSGKKATTIYPGTYNGGINVSGQATLNMDPGIYYMDGGGFSFTGQGSLNAAGVMIVNAPQSSSDLININGNGAINLSPPTSGIYAGISLWQVRSSTNDINVTGNGGSAMSGTFYTAHGTLNVTGNGTNDVLGAQYISYNLKVNGGGNFSVIWDPNLVARTRFIGLVE
jgi:Flp pilus assembly protein TadG